MAKTIYFYFLQMSVFFAACFQVLTIYMKKKKNAAIVQLFMFIYFLRDQRLQVENLLRKMKIWVVKESNVTLTGIYAETLFPRDVFVECYAANTHFNTTNIYILHSILHTGQYSKQVIQCKQNIWVENNTFTEAKG